MGFEPRSIWLQIHGPWLCFMLYVLCSCLTVDFLCQTFVCFTPDPTSLDIMQTFSKKAHPFQSHLLCAISGKTSHLDPTSLPLDMWSSCLQEVFLVIIFPQYPDKWMIRHSASLRLLLAFLKYPSRTMLAPPAWMGLRKRFLWNVFFKLVNDLRINWLRRQRAHRRTAKTFSCV